MKRIRNVPVVLPLLAVFILCVIIFRYYDYVIQRNFVMDVNAPCDTSTEQCFAVDCSPAEKPDCPDGPYKKIKIKNADAPRCLENHQCKFFSCGDIVSCTTTYCSSNSLTEGESCFQKPTTTIDSVSSTSKQST
jgi:hypothetical protein